MLLSKMLVKISITMLDNLILYQDCYHLSFIFITVALSFDFLIIFLFFCNLSQQSLYTEQKLLNYFNRINFNSI